MIKHVLLSLCLAAVFSTAALPATANIGYIAFDITNPPLAEFDIQNQTGPINSSTPPDSTFPVTTAVSLTSLSLTVNFVTGPSQSYGMSYFTLGSDKLSFNGAQNFNTVTGPVTSAILTGTFATTALTLNDGSLMNIAPGFSLTFTDNLGGPTLLDGDVAVITASPATTSAVPEPGAWMLLASGILSLLLWRGRKSVAFKSVSGKRIQPLIPAVACLIFLPSFLSAAVGLAQSTSPSAGISGFSNVWVTGNGFPAGALTASGTTVTLSTTCAGSGTSTAALAARNIAGTSDRVEFQIPGTLPAGAYFVSLSGVTSAGSAFKSANCSTLQVTVSAQPQRMVFAHYLVTNQDYQGDTDPTQELKITAYQKEIQQAQAAGIDGFALNVGGWLNQTYYIRYSAQIFEAATRLNSGFKLMFSADMCCGNAVNDVEDMMRRFANDPRYSQVYFKNNGKFVLTTFAGDALGTAAWQQIRSDLATGNNPSTTPEPTALAEVSHAPSNAPMPIFLVPAFFWGGEVPTQAGVQQGFNQWSSTIDGSFYWGIAGVPGSGGALDQLHSSEAYASVVHGGGKLYMAPVCLQFWGANANRYYEYSGFSGMRKMWMDAINTTHPDWVEIITWNDFIEGGYVSPIDDPNKYQYANYLDASGVPTSTLGYFHSHYAATDLLPYFIRWYKTGVQPALTNDALYYAYRTQSMNFDAGTPPIANKYGPVADVIYITANLTAPATLKVTSGGLSTLIPLPAGSTDVQAPFQAGNTPAFELDRNGATVVSGSATDPIQVSPKYNDYYYSTGDLVGPSL